MKVGDVVWAARRIQPDSMTVVPRFTKGIVSTVDGTLVTVRWATAAREFACFGHELTTTRPRIGRIVRNLEDALDKAYEAATALESNWPGLGPDERLAISRNKKLQESLLDALDQMKLIRKETTL